MLTAMALGGGLAALPAQAQQSDTARLNAILACGMVEKKAERLSCYDSLVRGTSGKLSKARKHEAELGVAPSADPGIVVTASPEKSFGSEDLPRTVKERTQHEIKQVIARATAATNDGIGHWTITLDNGTIWKMSETVPNFEPPHVGDAIRIRRASLGSFLMDVNFQTAVRVTRVH